MEMSVIQGLPPTYTDSSMLNKVATANNPENDGKVNTVQDINEVHYEEEKKAIYGHPLFPLMALLFEKCEQASQTPDCPTSESFDIDIQTFVQHQEKDRKPFFSEDPDLDNLMVRAIQVLRIHLLELEKVNELCKDFCTRYIACLKGKLQSEQLLRIDTDFDEYDMGSSPPSSGGQVNSMSSGILNPGVVNAGNNVVLQQPAVSMATLNQVYQMVQTPQGLVAQPIQIQTTPIQTQMPSTPVIHGGTPISQIGVVGGQVSQSPTSAGSTQQVSTAMAAGNLSDSDDDDPLGKKKSKRGILPKQATQIMKSWLFQHIVHPYPTEDEKRHIASQTNLTLLQVNNWFINARRRILQPMLDASNPEPAKKPKSKPQNRPLQRFWPESIANLQPQLPPGLQASSKVGGTSTTDSGIPSVMSQGDNTIQAADTQVNQSQTGLNTKMEYTSDHQNSQREDSGD